MHHWAQQVRRQGIRSADKLRCHSDIGALYKIVLQAKSLAVVTIPDLQTVHI